MKDKLSIWLAAARLRTLPLSVSGILVGNGLAFVHGTFSEVLFLLTLATTLAFQVLSNFANDFGDGIKGTDNDSRRGPARVLQLGLLSPLELKRGIIVCTIISMALAFVLIMIAFNKNQWLEIIFFLFLGIASVISAITYTVGKSAYGYFALGDLFVFVFFGLVSVLGSYYLQVKDFELLLTLPAISIGLFSTAVLNLNNMRDIESDTAANKITLPIILGLTNAKKYHIGLFLFGLLTSTLYAYLSGLTAIVFSYLILFPFLIIHLRRVWQSEGGKSFDSELKLVALGTFVFSLFFIVGFIVERL